MAARSYVYQLQEPVTRTFRDPSSGSTREETVTEITLRRPVAGDLRTLDQVSGDAAKGLALLARLSGLEMAVIDKIDIADFTELSKVIEGFTGPGQPTGETPSAS